MVSEVCAPTSQSFWYSKRNSILWVGHFLSAPTTEYVWIIDEKATKARKRWRSSYSSESQTKISPICVLRKGGRFCVICCRIFNHEWLAYWQVNFHTVPEQVWYSQSCWYWKPASVYVEFKENSVFISCLEPFCYDVWVAPVSCMLKMCCIWPWSIRFQTIGGLLELQEYWACV